ncbi:phosphotriesterase [Nocardia jiangxiensis]|uniref:Phosphotriesterase n=1 Tax=Nocardia jiangxiensis TaxID=282685 RepID=A0ABW6RYY2_9NOCA
MTSTGRSRGTVQTVAGPIAPDALGPTTMHEHILTVRGDTWRNRYRQRFPDAPNDIWNEPITLATRGRLQHSFTAQRANLTLDDDHIATAELRELADAGGRSLVEASGIGLRGDPRRIAAAAANAGIQVIMSTGFYCTDFWPARYHDATVDELTVLLVHELTEGIDNTDIRAGHIKCGVKTLDDREHRMLLAAAEASRHTGAPVTVHPGGGEGRRIARILLDAGLDPGRIVLAHADAYIVESNLQRLVTDLAAWTISLDYHHELLDLGVTLSFDCFGQNWAEPDLGLIIENDWQRLTAVTTLLREGFASQLVLGTDVFLPMLTRRGGGHGYRHLFAQVLPWMRTVGVPETDIEQMTTTNPRRLLAMGSIV